MTTADPIELLFGGMAQLGPGSDADTLHVLRLLPRQRFSLVVDAGCGTGRQTLALARALGTVVHALDVHAPFLETLRHRAGEEGLAQHVQPLCRDMSDIPRLFHGVDLLWSEGAAYGIGFDNALAAWAPALAPRGCVVASELSWLSDAPPADARAFFAAAYPAMRSVPANAQAAADAGYALLATYTLPRQAWTEGYYDVLGPRAKALLGHPDAAVRDFAAGTLREIEVFHRSDGSYGYVFYVLQRA